MFRYHLSFKLPINTAVVIFFVKSKTRSYKLKPHRFVNFYILRCDFYFFFFFYDHPDLQNWRVSANFKPYMNYWSRDISRIYYWKWVSPWHISTWWPIFSEALHFGHSVVVPNHICIAFNYQIYKFLVLNFYLICFFHEIIILGGFLMKWKRWQKILTLSWLQSTSLPTV
jgi:hypothetical protein